MNSQIELDNIIEAINKNDNIGIFTHISPDGDAIGSSLALYLGLKQLKKNVDIITDEYPNCFKFLTSIDEIKNTTKEHYDLAIALDCATKPRLYNPNNSFEQSSFSISIDHHASNTYFANLNYVEADSPAVSQTLVKILKRLNISITKEIGECLMAGIITDSGGFRYNTVDSETFEFAASMLGIGVNISDIYYKTFDLKTKPQFDLTTIATSRLKFFSKNRIAVTYITKGDFKKTKASVGDHEGIVNIGRNIENVEVSIFIREDEDGTYRVSLRSNKYVDVSEICKTFDGGGHARAAGCTVNTSLEDTIKLLVKEVNKNL